MKDFSSCPKCRRTSQMQREYRNNHRMKCSNPKCKRTIPQTSKRKYCFWCFRLIRFKQDKPLNDLKAYSPRYNKDGEYMFYPSKFNGNKYVDSNNDLQT